MNLKLTLLFVITLLLIGLGCTSKSADQLQPKKLTVADLQKLRWIEGTWRCTGEVDKPFFERYHFESDSVLAVDSFEDETLAKVTDTTRFELKDGEFGGGSSGSRYVAVGLDDRSIEFGPALKVRNGFRWERESQDLWKATILLPATKDKPARETIYKMERWPKKQ
jgi:hypothetical protein